MHAPKVFFCMIGAILIFAATTYYVSGSVSDTIIKSIIAAIILQVGYFMAIVYFVSKEAKARKAALGSEEQARTTQQDTGKMAARPEASQTAMRNN
ncbi:exopolysaccharide production repressor protein [Agrobacterium vitis]|nr:exopolysaccharide production repressor protein [Agrobacterium vitis]MBE1439279.1 exopolysaccharide production repressor protein [Agrobacterium vitis]